jgi:TetR/AcrR family transcriptional regulator
VTGLRVMKAERKRKPQARRTAILDEAIRMLGEHGFNGLTVQALAERCDISNAGLLYYFASKDELLLVILDEVEQREREVMTPLVQAVEQWRGDPARAWLTTVELLRQMVARFAQRPDLARLLFVLQSEALDRTHPAHDWFANRDQLTLGLFTSLLDGFVPDPLSTGRHLVSAMYGLGHHWLRQDRDFDLVQEWTKLSERILAPHAGRPLGGKPR